MLEELFKRFTREKLLLENVSPRTVKFYQQCFTAFKVTIGTDVPDRFDLNEFIIRLREKGYSAGGINVCIRGMNSFLTWLWRNNHISEKLRMKELRTEQKIIPTYSTADLKAFLSFKPKKPSEHRVYALVCLLIDTGTRIDECLTLTRENIDWDNLLIKVTGKGAKERLIPISLECRKVLFKYLQRHRYELVFCTSTGTRMTHRNAYRDLQNLCGKVGVEKASFHKFRHTFATEYLRSGGGELYLQKCLGHTTLAMTKRYAQISPEDLRSKHLKMSLLERVKR